LAMIYLRTVRYREGDDSLLTKLTVRAGTTKLLKYFAVSTRPAAIELLKQKLNNTTFAKGCVDVLKNLVTDSQIAANQIQNLKSPLRRVQGHLVSFVE